MTFSSRMPTFSPTRKRCASAANTCRAAASRAAFRFCHAREPEPGSANGEPKDRVTSRRRKTRRTASGTKSPIIVSPAPILVVRAVGLASPCSPCRFSPDQPARPPLAKHCPALDCCGLGATLGGRGVVSPLCGDGMQMQAFGIYLGNSVRCRQCFMLVVAKLGGVQIRQYALDHPPPHFHVIRGDEEVTCSYLTSP